MRTYYTTTIYHNIRNQNAKWRDTVYANVLTTTKLITLFYIRIPRFVGNVGGCWGFEAAKGIQYNGTQTERVFCDSNGVWLCCVLWGQVGSKLSPIIIIIILITTTVTVTLSPSSIRYDILSIKINNRIENGEGGSVRCMLFKKKKWAKMTICHEVSFVRSRFSCSFLFCSSISTLPMYQRSECFEIKSAFCVGTANCFTFCNL